MPVFTFTHHQYFSLEKANRALVLVRPVVRDLLGRYESLTLMQEKTLDIEEKLRICEHEEGPEFELLSGLLYDLREQTAELLDEIAHFIEELFQIGCICKDFRTGTVDFPSIFSGREVYLCWKYGEDEITHWHEVEEGFDTRHLIQPDTVPTFRAESLPV